MGKVEPEAVRGDERSRLLYVISEHFAQDRVQDVCRGVVEFGVLAQLGVDGQMDGIADVEDPGLNLADMNDQVSGKLHGIGDGYFSGGPGYQSPCRPPARLLRRKKGCRP